MSEEPRDLYFHDQYFPFFATNGNQQRFLDHDPTSSSSMRFTEYLHGSSTDHFSSLSSAFGLSSSPTPSSEVPFPTHNKDAQNPNKETPVTPNSSVMNYSSSTEAGDDDDDQELNNNGKKDKLSNTTLSEDGGSESSKKVNKQKTIKGSEKKQREPRFAFMTKSEVDHLEDGYRWRKYGQKAVKNSPYPRSYYRCTTQKCAVKKRVERSFQDPSVVITTYEGQHNHHLPSTLRGNVAAAGLIYQYHPSMMTMAQGIGGEASFPQDLLAQMPQLYDYGGIGSSSINAAAAAAGRSQLAALQQLQLPDYGLLQDMVPSMSTFKQEP